MPKLREETPPTSFKNQDEILLGLLSAVDQNAQVSQRTISRELNVALGLANAYLKRCVHKGWIKIKQVPRRRFAYYLTPQGFAEKSRLTAQYFVASFEFFRSAREQMSTLMAECTALGWQRIVFAGASELAEVGTLCAHDHPVTIVAVLDPEYSGERFSGLPVKKSIAECGDVDAVIVTSIRAPYRTRQRVTSEFASDRVFAPRLLRLPTSQGAEAAE